MSDEIRGGWERTVRFEAMVDRASRWRPFRPPRRGYRGRVAHWDVHRHRTINRNCLRWRADRDAAESDAIALATKLARKQR